MSELLHDTNFWVLLSFIIFVGVFLKYGKAKALASLDEKISSIKTELETAEKLRVDAQELLAEYQRKHMDAMSEAAQIISHARQQAESLKSKAESDLAETLKRREAQLDERLTRIEQNARQEIEAYTAKIAVNAAKNLLTEKIDAKSDKDIINNVLGNVSKTLN